jgi:hypothetical protein
MKELLEIASEFDGLAARLAVLKERHSSNVDAESRLEAAYQSSKRAAQLVRRQARTMRPQRSL